MIKNKGFMVMSSIIVTLVTFFVGSALAERVTRDNKGEGYVFIGGLVKEIIVSESVVEENRKLVGWERKKRKSTYQKWKEFLDKQSIIQDDYIKRRQEEERIKEQEEEEKIREQEEEKIREQEMEQERERIKKEDWFR